MAEFDYLGAKQAGASDEEIQSFLKANGTDFDLIGAKQAGATDDEISTFLKSQPVKKKEVSKPTTQVSSNGTTKTSQSSYNLDLSLPKVNPNPNNKALPGLGQPFKPEIALKSINDERKFINAKTPTQTNFQDYNTVINDGIKGQNKFDNTTQILTSQNVIPQQAKKEVQQLQQKQQVVKDAKKDTRQNILAVIPELADAKNTDEAISTILKSDMKNNLDYWQQFDDEALLGNDENTLNDFLVSNGLKNQDRELYLKEQASSNPKYGYEYEYNKIGSLFKAVKQRADDYDTVLKQKFGDNYMEVAKQGNSDILNDQDFNKFRQLREKQNELSTKANGLINDSRYSEVKSSREKVEKAQQGVDERAKNDKAYKIGDELNYIGNKLAYGAGHIVKMIAEIPSLATSFDKGYDWTDRVADWGERFSNKLVDAIPESTDVKAGGINSVAKVNGNKVIVDKEGNPIDVRDENNFKVDNATYQIVTDEYNSDRKKYNINTEFNPRSIINNGLNTMIDMGIMILGTKGAGMVGAGEKLQKLTSMGIAYQQTKRDVFNDAIKKGLDPRNADLLSNIIGVAAGTSSMLNPMEFNIAKGAGLFNLLKTDGLNAAKLALIKEGKLSVKDYAKEFVKEGIKNTGGEWVEELGIESTTQAIANNHFNNQISETDMVDSGLDDRLHILDKQGLETFLITAGSSFLMTPIEINSQTQFNQQEAMKMAIENPEDFAKIKELQLKQGQINQQQFDNETKIYNDVSKTYNAVKDDVKEELQSQLLALLTKKSNLSNKISEIKDEVLSKPYKDQLEQVNKGIESISVGKNADKRLVAPIEQSEILAESTAKDGSSTISKTETAIANKINKGQELTAEETDYYNAQKDSIDKLVTVNKSPIVPINETVEVEKKEIVLPPPTPQVVAPAELDEQQITEQLNEVLNDKTTPTPLVDTEQEQNISERLPSEYQNNQGVQQINGIGQDVSNESEVPQIQQEQEQIEIPERKIQLWYDDFDKLKDTGSAEDLDMFYNKVKVVLNGIAQSKGEDVVKEFESLKKEIEDYAVEFKDKNLSKTEEITPKKSIEVDRNVDRDKIETKELKFTTHTGEVVSGKRLDNAINKVADDIIESAKKRRKEHYASHITETQKDEILAKDLKYAEEIRQGKYLNNLGHAQSINYELTGESVPILPKEQEQEAGSEGVGGDVKLADIESFETSRGSVYTVLPDGRTQRFKTATGEKNEPQDLIVFAKFKDVMQEDRYLEAVQRSKESGNKVYVVDENGKVVKNNSEIKGRIGLAIVDKNGKAIETIEVSPTPKEGYNTYDERRWKENGEDYTQRHIGNEVSKINYKQKAVEQSLKETPKAGSVVGGDVGSKLEKPYKTVNDGSGKMVKVVVTTTEKNGVKTTKFKTQTTNKQGESREQNDKGFNTFEEAVENLGIDLKSEENESALELIQAVKESQGKENIPVRVTEIREGTDKSSPFYGKKVATLVVGGEKVDVILEQSLKEGQSKVETEKPANQKTQDDIKQKKDELGQKLFNIAPKNEVQQNGQNVSNDSEVLSTKTEEITPKKTIEVDRNVDIADNNQENIETSSSKKLKTNGNTEEGFSGVFGEEIVDNKGNVVGVKISDTRPNGGKYYQTLVDDTPENRKGFGWQEHMDIDSKIFKKFETLDDLEKFINAKETPTTKEETKSTVSKTEIVKNTKTEVSETPIKDEWDKRVDTIDTETSYTDLSELKEGDVILTKTGTLGFVKKINPKKVIFETTNGGMGGNDVSLMELSANKDDIRVFKKPKIENKKAVGIKKTENVAEISPNKNVSASKASAIKDLLTKTDKYNDLTEMEAGILATIDGTELYDDLVEAFGNKFKGIGLKGSVILKLIEKGYIEDVDYSNENFTITKKGNNFKDALSARIETRKGIKQGTDLFPTYAGLTGKELIGDALDRIADKIGSKKNLTQQERTSLKKDVADIGKGLIQLGKATIDNVIEKIKDEIKKRFSNLDDNTVNQIASDALEDIKATNYFNKSDIDEFLDLHKKDTGTIESLKAEIGEENYNKIVQQFGEKYIKEALGVKEVEENKDETKKELNDSKQRVAERIVLGNSTLNAVKEHIVQQGYDKSDYDSKQIFKDVDELINKFGIEKAESFIDKIGDVGLSEPHKVVLQHKIAEYYGNKALSDETLTEEERKEAMFKSAQLFLDLSQQRTDAGRGNAILAQIYLESDIYFTLPYFEDKMNAIGAQLSGAEKIELENLQNEIKELRKENTKLQELAKKEAEQQIVDDITTHLLVDDLIIDSKIKDDLEVKNAKSILAKGFEDIARMLSSIAMAQQVDKVKFKDTILDMTKATMTISKIGVKKALKSVIKAIKNANQNIDEKLLEDAQKHVLSQIKETDTGIKKKNKEGISKDELIELIEQGADTMEKMVEAIRDKYYDGDKSISDKQIRDEITNYGNSIRQSQTQVEEKLSEIKSLMLLQSKLEDAENNIAPKKTGFIRDKDKIAVREKRRELAEAMKKLTVTLSEDDIAGLNERKLTQIANKIEEVQKVLDGYEKIKNKANFDYNDAVKKKQQELDDLMSSQKALLHYAKENLTNLVAKYQDKLDKKQYSKNPTLNKLSITDSEYQKLKNQLEAKKEQLKSERDNFRNNNADYLLENRQKQIDRQIVEIDNLLAGIKVRKTSEQIKAEKDRKAGVINSSTNQTALDKLKENQKVLEAKKEQWERKVIQKEVEIEKAKQTWLQKLGINAMSISRTLTLGFTDIGWLGVQGGYFARTKPHLFAKALKESFKGKLSEEAFNQWKRDLKSNPFYETMIKAGLRIPSQSLRDDIFEQEFRESGFTKLLGKNEVTDIVNKNARLSVKFLANLRIQVFQKMYNGLTDSQKADKEVLEKLADYVNSRSGAGQVIGEDNKRGLNKWWGLLTSARNTSAMLQQTYIGMLYGLAKNYVRNKPLSNQPIIARQLVNDLLNQAVLFSGLYLSYLIANGLSGDDDEWNVETSPFSTNFLKLKNKEGDRSYFDMGGMTALNVATLRLLTTITNAFGTDFDNFKDYKGEYSKVGLKDFSSKTGLQILSESIFNRTLSLLAPIKNPFTAKSDKDGNYSMYGKTYTPTEFKLKMLMDMFIPMNLPNIYNDITDKDVNALNAIVNTVLNVIGVSNQNQKYDRPEDSTSPQVNSVPVKSTPVSSMPIVPIPVK